MTLCVSFILVLFWSIFFLLPCVAVSLYYGLFVVLRLCGFKSQYNGGLSRQKKRFAIVIPAHNEAEIIETTLASVQGINFPQEQFTVFVVADNCSDTTAEIARKQDCEVLERFDTERSGKGCALAWAFGQILPQDYDAVAVLDADCTISPDALNVYESLLQQGKRVLQSHYFVGNPDENVISFAAAVGNALEYELFYAPKSVCGLAVMLVGTGMVFDKSVLLENPWTANSLTEDAEYAVQLAENDVQVTFVSNIKVTQNASAHQSQLRVQRARWAKGTSDLAYQRGVKLAINGLCRAKLYLADLGFTLFVVSRAFIFCGILLTAALSVPVAFLATPALRIPLLCTAWACVMLNVLYVMTAFYFVGITRHRLVMLCQSPLILCQMAWLSFKSFFSKKHSWSKTPRS
ncbi:MAG: glycosyltransferase family 2 protein [Planctomycetaceae bacterium]|jgi:cellulose synthase/poly-beta-1,6-N-acetylglucosamine synthase-like glycosyltransferase|nr:glycosyltransferase family 2 protein [Planctomycetaceae bacterium]